MKPWDLDFQNWLLQEGDQNSPSFRIAKLDEEDRKRSAKERSLASLALKVQASQEPTHLFMRDGSCHLADQEKELEAKIMDDEVNLRAEKSKNQEAMLRAVGAIRNPQALETREGRASLAQAMMEPEGRASLVRAMTEPVRRALELKHIEIFEQAKKLGLNYCCTWKTDGVGGNPECKYEFSDSQHRPVAIANGEHAATKVLECLKSLKKNGYFDQLGMAPHEGKSDVP